MERVIDFTYRGPRADIGEMVIYRTLPNAQRRAVGPFIFLDFISRVEFPPRHPQPPTSVGAHPHRGIATFTYLLRGEFEHYDSRGQYGVVGNGGAQWMSAGNGIVHDEHFSQAFQLTGGPLLGLQFWINLPAAAKQQLPDYLPVQAQDFPQWPLAGEAGFFKLLIGRYDGHSSQVRTFSEQFLYHLQLAPGQSFALETESRLEYAAFVPAGAATINGQPLREGELLGFGAAGTTVRVENTAPAPADILLFGGEPYTEPIVAQGPFVMNSAEEIVEAFRDFRAGKYGTVNHTA
ncbi:MAG: pirin family protein [Hymenobacter sp.]|nr:pirin family protein [Hymenobacter sp.]